MIKFTTKLFLILAATLLPTGVWGEDKNVYSVYDQFFALWLKFKGLN